MQDVIGFLIGYGMVYGLIIMTGLGVCCGIAAIINAFVASSALFESPAKISPSLPKTKAPKTKAPKTPAKPKKSKKCAVRVVSHFADKFKLPEMPFS